MDTYFTSQTNIINVNIETMSQDAFEKQRALLKTDKQKDSFKKDENLLKQQIELNLRRMIHIKAKQEK